MTVYKDAYISPRQNPDSGGIAGPAVDSRESSLSVTPRPISFEEAFRLCEIDMGNMTGKSHDPCKKVYVINLCCWRVQRDPTLDLIQMHLAIFRT